MKRYEEIAGIFEKAHISFLEEEKDLFSSQVSERTLCGALMLHIHDLLRSEDYREGYEGYYVDVEYNRNKGGRIKTAYKTIRGPEYKEIPITCDLILHSRGGNTKQDNLLAIEMKKSNRLRSEKEADRDRLIALTKDSFDDVWAYDGKSLPEHVCRYVLGVYYEINYSRKEILIEYYKQGAMVHTYTVGF